MHITHAPASYPLPFQPDSELIEGQKTNVPSNVVTPTDGLDPMNGAGRKPDNVAGTLKETIDRDSHLKQFLRSKENVRRG